MFVLFYLIYFVFKQRCAMDLFIFFFTIYFVQSMVLPYVFVLVLWIFSMKKKNVCLFVCLFTILWNNLDNLLMEIFPFFFKTFRSCKEHCNWKLCAKWPTIFDRNMKEINEYQFGSKIYIHIGYWETGTHNKWIHKIKFKDFQFTNLKQKKKKIRIEIMWEQKKNKNNNLYNVSFFFFFE